ncbi:MAG TPA: transposase [Candidatus Methylomirabilis sp.]|nr:transposase [Candidatus Methylomirabilis sp.]
MVRGIERRPIFTDNRDRDDFIQRLVTLVTEVGLTVYAWALLPNHAHLLVRTGPRPLARMMRSLLTGYAGTFNLRHRRKGHLFQNRYKSIVVEEELYFLELVRYIHLNPLRSGVVKSLRALDYYPYSGHAAILGTARCPWQAIDEVLGRFATQGRRARAKYRSFVEAGIPLGRRPELQGGGLIRSAGGWAAVQALRRGREAFTADERILGSGDFVDDLLREAEQQTREEERIRRRSVDLQTLAHRIGNSLGVKPDAILGQSRNRVITRARHLLTYVWVEHLGRSASHLARLLGRTRSNVSWAVKRGTEASRSWTRVIEAWCR